MYAVARVRFSGETPVVQYRITVSQLGRKRGRFGIPYIGWKKKREWVDWKTWKQWNL